MRHFKGLLLLFCIHLLFACQKDKTSQPVDLLGLLPAETTVLSKIDLDRLLNRTDHQTLSTDDCFRGMIQKLQRQNPILARIIEQPKNSGVNFQKAAYLTQEINPENINQSFTAFTLSLQKVADFAKLVEDADFGALQTKDGFQYAIRSNTIVAWDNSVAVLGGSRGKMDLLKNVAQILNAEATSTLAQDGDLQQCLSSPHDVVIWMNSNSIAKSQEIQSILGFGGLDPKLLNNNYLHHYLDFEDGAMVASTNYRLQEDLSQKINLLVKDELSPGFLDFLPANPDFLFGAALDMKGAETFFSSTLQLGMVSSFALKSYGLQLEDLDKIFGGDLVMANYRGTDKNTGILALSIKDQEGLEQLLQFASKNGSISKNKSGTYDVKAFNNPLQMGSDYLNFTSQKSTLLLYDNKLIISNDKALLQGMQDNNDQSTKLTSEELKTFNNQSFAILSIIENYATNNRPSNANPFSVLKTQSDRKQVNYNLTMKDKKQNSLYGLCTLFDLF